MHHNRSTNADASNYETYTTANAHANAFSNTANNGPTDTIANAAANANAFSEAVTDRMLSFVCFVCDMQSHRTNRL